jgi:SAM-dependent methyltransferase
MLTLATQIVHGREPVEVSLPSFGYGSLSIPAYGAQSPAFARADVENIPVKDDGADITLCVNVVDRLPHGPDVALRECHRILRKGGRLIFTDPLNWTTPDLWQRYPDGASLLQLLREIGFRVDTWFDNLLYRELLDARHSTEEFRTLIVSAIKD